MLTTLQDLGRWGAQHHGVSVSGAMDRLSLRLANRLVGNRDQTAALEVTLAGPTIRFNRESQVAVSGAEFILRLDEYEVSSETLLSIGSGQCLMFGRRLSGARAYIAVAGG
ncbi:MAG TPA: carboxylase, partial [Acidobacteria bacterium]|nr:carboxylase [Acidobacteriota bacterium]